MTGGTPPKPQGVDPEASYKQLEFSGWPELLRAEEEEIPPLQCFPDLAVSQSLKSFLKTQVPRQHPEGHIPGFY